MATASKSRYKNSCPDGWLNAGAKVPIRLTVRQEEYCRQAVDIHRFCYNLAVRTHRFCRSNRLSWPSWMDISKAFNAGKREDHPFVTQVAAVAAAGAFRDFGQAVDLPFPPTEEQRMMAVALGEATANIDTTIANARRQIEFMEEYWTRLIADVVTGKMDVREATP